MSGVRRNGGERPGGGFDGNTYSRLKFSNKFVSFKLKLIKPSYGPPLHRRPLKTAAKCAVPQPKRKDAG